MRESVMASSNGARLDWQAHHSLDGGAAEELEGDHRADRVAWEPQVGIRVANSKVPNASGLPGSCGPSRRRFTLSREDILDDVVVAAGDASRSNHMSARSGEDLAVSAPTVSEAMPRFRDAAVVSDRRREAVRVAVVDLPAGGRPGSSSSSPVERSRPPACV